jgi:hypothetical protein
MGNGHPTYTGKVLRGRRWTQKRRCRGCCGRSHERYTFQADFFELGGAGIDAALQKGHAPASAAARHRVKSAIGYSAVIAMVSGGAPSSPPRRRANRLATPARCGRAPRATGLSALSVSRGRSRSGSGSSRSTWPRTMVLVPKISAFRRAHGAGRSRVPYAHPGTSVRHYGAGISALARHGFSGG